MPHIKFLTMKKLFLTFALAAVLVAPLFAEGTNDLSDQKTRVSYAIGVMLGQNFLRRQNLDADTVSVDWIARGMKDVQSSNTMLLSEEDVKATLVAFQKDFGARMQKARGEMAIKNQAAGETFLATNKNNPGVQTLADGLQYLVITNGNGATPSANDTVTVNYRGTLIDGTEFDNSYKRGQPLTREVGGLIRGWTEALEQMPVGSKWKLFIPANLAYGEQGRPGIPPNATLIFEVELLSVQASAPPPPAVAPAPPLTSDIIKVPSAEEMKHGAKIETIKPEDIQKYQSQSQTN
jgi:FKBP-type peptidyl-prolyl cis-trans isomerase FklB